MLEQSMNFLWAKQAAHLDNITNAETPGYKVKTVRFEEEFAEKLREAVQSETKKDREMGTMRKTRQVIEEADWTVTEDEETTRMDENGVNVIEQSLEAVRTAYQLQYVMQTMSSDIARLRAAITG